MAGGGAEAAAAAAAAGCTAGAFSATRAARLSSATEEGISSNRAAGREARALRRMRKEHGAAARGTGEGAERAVVHVFVCAVRAEK